MRLDNAVAIFLAEWPAEGVPKATVRSYGQALAWFTGFATSHGKLGLSDALTPSFVRTAILNKMQERSTLQRAPNYKGGEAAGAQVAYATRRLARWLLDQGVRVEDLSMVVAPRVPQRIQTRLHAQEFDALESAVLHRLLSGRKRVPHLAVARDLALLHFLGETGLRAEEVCRIELSDLNFEQGWVLVHGKGSKERMLSIVGASDGDDPERVIRLLRDWLDAREAIRGAARHQRLWTSTRGTPLNTDELRKILARICLEAGMASSRPPHAFRRYVFTEHYKERPGAIRRLAARMGWSERSHKMISIYTHGVELELAREPLPLLSTRRREVGSPNVRLRWQPPPAVTRNGVGPPERATANGRAAPTRSGKEADTAACQPALRADACNRNGCVTGGTFTRD